MSVDLNEIKGTFEYVKDIQEKEVGYGTAYLSLCSFYGGKERGPCLQLTLVSNSISHIQITKEEAKKLRDELIGWIGEELRAE